MGHKEALDAALKVADALAEKGEEMMMAQHAEIERLQALNAELLAALKAVDEWLMDGFSEEDADSSSWRTDFRKALKLTKSAIARAESQQ